MLGKIAHVFAWVDPWFEGWIHLHLQQCGYFALI
jgi:hypothetical protein